MVRVSRPIASPKFLAVAALAPLLLAAACLITPAVGEAWLGSRPPATVPADRLVNLCASLRLLGGWRASVWWEPAVSARTGRLRRPFIQPNMACGLIPWQAWLPSAGDLETSR